MGSLGSARSYVTMTARLLYLSLCLVTLLHTSTANKRQANRIDQQQVFEAIPTQLETPPEGHHEDDEELFDLDYIVNRPVGGDDEESGLPECNYDSDHGGEGLEEECVDKTADKTPYKKYKKYKTWKRRPLLVIIIGGLRWDYLTPSWWNMTDMAGDRLKAFDWIQKHGSTMKQVVPVFPPYDLPVWTSMATGLYPKNTGVIGDHMFNLNSRELFSKEDSTGDLENWWLQGEPIWSLAAKHGRKVSVINWHDCKLPGKNLENPEDCKPFDRTEKKTSRQMMTRMFNRAITKIHKDNYDLSMVYIDSLKKVAKSHGPNSKEVMDELAVIDEVLQGRLSDIKTKKERADLKLNILLLSDYGLNGVEKTTKIVLDDYLEFNHTQYIIQRGGSCVLVPFALRAGDIMRGVGNKLGVANMVGVSAYVRDTELEIPSLDYPEIPEDLKYAGRTWTQDILLVAKPGFEIVINTDSPKVLPPLNDDLGISGFIPAPDPPFIVPGREKHKSKELRQREKEEVELFDIFSHMMKTIGFAWGPDFKSGYTLKENIEIVDIYQIMAFLLQVPPADHDGNWERVKDMLMISSAPAPLPLSLLLVLTCSLALAWIS